MTAWRISGLAIGLITGIVAAAQGWVIPPMLLWLLAAAGAGATAAAIMAERHWIAWPKLLVAFLAASCAMPLGFLRTQELVGPPGPDSLRYILAEVPPATRVTVRGSLYAEPELRGAGQLDLFIRPTEIRIGGNEATWQPVTRGNLLLRAYTRATNADAIHEHFNRLASPSAYGWIVEATATYRPIEAPLNPGAFDYATFLRQSGVDTRLRCHAAAVHVIEESRGNPVMALALAAKTSFLETFKATIRSPASRLTSAATLGTRRAVDNIDYRGHDLATLLRHAGVGHVLAVSGLHVSVISVMLYALFRMTGAKPKAFVPFLIAFLILFALLTGARPSSVRAVIMNSVILIAIAYLRVGLRSATATGLSLSAFFILMRNPTALFAPSFLLSYGAVLSLILLAPPLDRLLCMLRGFTLLFGAIWFATVLRLAGWHLAWLLHPPNLLAVLGALWLLILAGTRLNHRFPALWGVNLERIPTVIRIFFAAQLAIQLGMMIPLSAWFFGLFPVAGVLVNLLAIPAVGVLVQLGMLTGLVGLLPVVGPWLAIPFGAAATLAGDFFILLAYAGASVFPFPPTPMPSTLWMTIYYVGLGLALFLEAHRAWLVGGLYRLVPPGPAAPARRLVAALPIVLVLAPLLWRGPSQPTLREVRVLADGRYPILLLTGPRTSSIVNAGGSFTGGRLVFDSMRQSGAVSIDTAILPSSEPRAGIAGVGELLERMPVQSVLLGILPEPDQTMPEAIGDDYLLRQVAQGNFWAVNMERDFETLRTRAKEQGTRLALLTDETIPSWNNAELRLLPPPSERPDRFVSSALTPILHGVINGLEWIVITETTPEALFDALADVTSSDVLVVPNLNTFPTYGRWLRTALIRAKPRLLIIAGDAPLEPEQFASWLPSDPDRVVIQTGEEGAVTARLRAGETRFETYRGQTRLTLQ